MQVSAAAAIDLGGGDRFDLTQNRLLGRAYLARLYRRYGNWPDAVAAYNWGPGNLDAWIATGTAGRGIAARSRALSRPGAARRRHPASAGLAVVAHRLGAADAITVRGRREGTSIVPAHPANSFSKPAYIGYVLG